MKPNVILFQDEDGNIKEVTHKEYVKALIAELNVQEHKNEESGVAYPADKIVNYIVVSVRDGMSGELQPMFTENYSDVINRVESDYAEARKLDEKLSSSKKQEKEKDTEKRKQEAEEKKKAKEAAEKERLELQSLFADGYQKGAERAKEDLVKDLTAFKEGLPEGFEVRMNGHSIGLVVSENIKKEDIGFALGFIQSKQESAGLVANQFSFLVGDLANAAVKEGIYPSVIEAGKQLSADLEKRGRIISGRGIEGFARMASRIPMDRRNPYVQPSAYLTVANLPVLKKKDGESDEDFKTRNESYEKSKDELVDRMFQGNAVVHKEAKEEVAKIQIKHGLKEAPTPSTPTLTLRNHLENMFHARFGLDHLVGVKEKDSVHYEKDGNIISISKADLQSLYERSYAAVQNILYTGSDKDGAIKPEEYMKGFKMVTKLVPDGVDPNTGKATTSTEEVRVEVVPQFRIASEVSPDSGKEPETAAPEATEEKPKKGKSKAK